MFQYILGMACDVFRQAIRINRSVDRLFWTKAGLDQPRLRILGTDGTDAADFIELNALTISWYKGIDKRIGLGRVLKVALQKLLWKYIDVEGDTTWLNHE
jgi:hypothetical protein